MAENGPTLAGAKLALLTIEYTYRAHRERARRAAEALISAMNEMRDATDDEELN